MTSIWFVSPAFRRYDVTRMCLAQRDHAMGELRKAGFDARSLVVASDDNLEIAREFGMETLEHPNDPLARKANAGLRHACLEGADWVVWVGSDDWVHPDLFTPLHEYGESSYHMWPIVTGRKIAVVDLLTGRLAVCHAPGENGVIPWLIHRKLLEPAGFAPLKAQKRRGLDGNLVQGLRRHRIKPEWRFHDPHELCRVDFKSETNITTFDALRSLARYETDNPWVELVDVYPAHLVDMARDLHLSLV